MYWVCWGGNYERPGYMFYLGLWDLGVCLYILICDSKQLTKHQGTCYKYLEPIKGLCSSNEILFIPRSNLAHEVPGCVPIHFSNYQRPKILTIFRKDTPMSGGQYKDIQRVHRVLIQLFPSITQVYLRQVLSYLSRTHAEWGPVKYSPNTELEESTRFVSLIKSN